MATYTLAPDFNTLVTEVLDVLQMAADGETVTADMQLRVKNAYNYMVASWQAQGFHLWANTEGRLYLKNGQGEYDTSVASSSNKFARITNSPIDDTLGADAASGASTITVSDGTLWANGDNIGILQDDDTLHWTTINGAPAGNVITLTAVTTDTCTSGAWVTGYNDTYKPISRLKDDYSRTYKSSNLQETNAVSIDRQTYFQLSDKTTTGVPVQLYFARTETVGSSGQGHKFYTYPVPSSAEYAINFTYERQLQLVDTPGTDVIDFPRYWHDAVVWNVADRVKSRFGTGADLSATISQTANNLLNEALSYDNAVTSFEIRVV